MSPYQRELVLHPQTQERVAKRLGIKQENVSRIEQRADLLISTLRGYVEAMGGKLRLVAEFPDRPAIELSGLAAMDREKHAAPESGVVSGVVTEPDNRSER